MGSSPRVHRAQRSSGLLTRRGVAVPHAWHRRWLAPTDLCPRLGVGEHQGTSAVLLDPKVEFGRPCSALATTAAMRVCSRAFLKLHGGLPGGAFIGHSSGMEHNYSTAKSISNSSLEAMTTLGFIKGKQFLIQF
jgi:hypothetical protein